MKLIAINPPSTITEPQIPDVIARDSEVTAAIASHVAATDPHPTYLTQTEGDGRYRQTATPLVDADIPAAIARDTEVTAQIASHTAAADPHTQYLLETGKAADSELIDGIDSSRLVAGGDWSRALGDLNIDSVITSNSGFFDCWTPNGGTFPAGYSHFHGFQCRHRNSSSTWGMQVGAQHNTNELFFRTISGGSWNPWCRTWNDRNFNPSSHAQNFNGSTAKSVGVSGGNFFSETNNCGYEIQARDSSSAAYLSFHRPGSFAFHFGLDTDNQLKIGGWSYGGASYQIWHEGNFNANTALSQDRPFFASVLPVASIAGNSIGFGWNSVQAGLGVAEICNYAGTGGGDAFSFFRMPGAAAARPTLTNRVSRIDILGNYVVTSDARVKSNIAKSPGLDIIKLLTPRKYDHHTDNLSENGRIIKGRKFKKKLGFLAQELEKIIPEAVYPPKDTNELYGVDYNCLITIAIQAIKEQQEQIEKLQGQIIDFKQQKTS